MKKIAALLLLASATFMVSCGPSAEEKKKAYDDSVAKAKKDSIKRDSDLNNVMNFIDANGADAQKDSLKKDSLKKDSIAKAAGKTPQKAGK